MCRMALFFCSASEEFVMSGYFSAQQCTQPWATSNGRDRPSTHAGIHSGTNLWKYHMALSALQVEPEECLAIKDAGVRCEIDGRMYKRHCHH